MGPPENEPIGLNLARTSKLVSRGFDDALAQVGGSLPVWLILVSLKSGRYGAQREIAEAIGIEGPTLTHHLNRLEQAGLVSRTRDPQNRRSHQVELTEAGQEAFFRMVRVVQAFDRRLRAGMGARELSTLEQLLGRLRENAAGDG